MWWPLVSFCGGAVVFKSSVTSIALYTEKQFGGTPLILRSPRVDGKSGFFALDQAYAESLSSLLVLWDTKDAPAGTGIACDKLCRCTDAVVSTCRCPVVADHSVPWAKPG